MARRATQAQWQPGPSRLRVAQPPSARVKLATQPLGFSCQDDLVAGTSSRRLDLFSARVCVAPSPSASVRRRVVRPPSVFCCGRSVWVFVSCARRCFVAIVIESTPRSVRVLGARVFCFGPVHVGVRERRRCLALCRGHRMNAGNWPLVLVVDNGNNGDSDGRDAAPTA